MGRPHGIDNCDECGGRLDTVRLKDEDWQAIQAGRDDPTVGHYICSWCMDAAAKRFGRRIVGEIFFGWDNDGSGLVVGEVRGRDVC